MGVPVGVTRHPSAAWLAQQLREAMPCGSTPRYVIRTHNSTYGTAFARIAAASSSAVLRPPYRAPRANALCERFLGSVRRECLDHLLILHETHLRRVLEQYVAYFNRDRPHQALEQSLPEPATSPGTVARGTGQVISIPVLGGLHHTYRRVA